MPSETRFEEPSLDEQIRAAFVKPDTEHALVTLPSVSISDAVITAQKVAVERDDAKVLARIKVFAAAAGEDWFYRYPVKNNRTGQTDWIEGPSIKCANNVARFYGNCQVDTRIHDNGDSWIIYARFVDYETGFSYTRPFQQRKGQQSIRGKDVDRQLDIALQIGVSKAIRNVVCNALETFTNFAFDEAKNAIVGKVGKNLERYRDRVIGRLTELGVALATVETTVGRAAKEWLAPDVARLIAQLQAINDGMATIAETWPVDPAARPTRDDFKGEGAAETTTTQANDAAEPEPFEVISVDGEPQVYADPQRAVAVYREALDEGEKRRGEAGLTGVFESNGQLFTALEERGFKEVSKTLSEEYGVRRQAAAARDRDAKEKAPREAASTPGAKAADAKPPRSPLWQETSFTVTRPMKPDGRQIDFKALGELLTWFVGDADTVGELDKFEIDNEDNIRKVLDAYPANGEDVREAIRNRRAELL